MAAIIIGNGDIREYSYYTRYIKLPKLVICADGGARHLKKLGLRPDVLLGDFDSISGEDYKSYIDSGVEVVRYPAKKDTTDMEIAVDYAIDKGRKSIIIIGGIGSRIDHSLSNFFLLKKMMDNNVRGMIADENNEVMLINDKVTLKKDEGFKVSLIPVGKKAEGVTTKSLCYQLDDATLEFGSTRGISNEFVEEQAEVSVRSGLLLVIKSRD